MGAGIRLNMVPFLGAHSTSSDAGQLTYDKIAWISSGGPIFNILSIVNYQPFRIQLLYGSYEYKQEVKIGVDLGAKHIGIAIQSQNQVLAKGEIELRDDIKANLESRKTYRKSRCNRKTRYRKARFLNRTSSKKEGWLPPSIRNKIDHTFRWIVRFSSLLPNPKLIIEVGKFNVQKMINPAIQGIEYQQGDLFSYHDVRYFVFTRDNYTCQVCKKKGKILNTHHIVYRSHGGTDRANNLISACTDCHTHENHIFTDQQAIEVWKQLSSEYFEKFLTNELSFQE
ncbi:RNA-guided endonuclease IscB [Sutcliffiella sp. BMC8]|uniref:RNA-guided endonuclease IscB n=1 Tax=Sutcliffiella sp. BMC8 TaxID=3073243 RepID=UPI0030CD3945